MSNLKDVKYGCTVIVSGNNHITRQILYENEMIRCNKCKKVNRIKKTCWWISCCNTKCNHNISKTTTRLLTTKYLNEMKNSFKPNEIYKCYNCLCEFKPNHICKKVVCAKCKTRYTVSYDRLQKIYPKLKINKNKSKLNYQTTSILNAVNQMEKYKKLNKKDNTKLDIFANIVVNYVKSETLV